MEQDILSILFPQLFFGAQGSDLSPSIGDPLQYPGGEITPYNIGLPMQDVPHLSNLNFNNWGVQLPEFQQMQLPSFTRGHIMPAQQFNAPQQMQLPQAPAIRI